MELGSARGPKTDQRAIKTNASEARYHHSKDLHRKIAGEVRDMTFHRKMYAKLSQNSAADRFDFSTFSNGF